MRAPRNQVLLARAFGLYLHAEMLLEPCPSEFARARGLLAADHLIEALKVVRSI